MPSIIRRVRNQLIRSSTVQDKGRFRCLTARQDLCFLLLVFATVSGCWTQVPYDGPIEATSAPRSHRRTDGNGTGAQRRNFRAEDDDEESIPVEPSFQNASPDQAEDIFAGVGSVLHGGEAAEFEGQAPSPASRPPQELELFPSETSSNTELQPLPLDDEEQPDPISVGDSTEMPQLLSHHSNSRTKADDRLRGADNARHAAWLLGGKLSLSALAHDLGAAPRDAQVWFQEARLVADVLGTPLPGLPTMPTGGSNDSVSAAMLEFLLPLGREVGEDIFHGHGPEHAALFELAFKSNLLLVLYGPQRSWVSFAAAIRSAGERARLPNRFWQPLLDAITENAEQQVVDEAVYALHRDVDQFLAE